MHFRLLAAGVAAFLALSVFSSALASAQNYFHDPWDFYWGVGGGASRNSEWCAQEGLTTCEDTAFAPKAFIGLTFTPLLRIELGYLEMGSFDYPGVSPVSISGDQFRPERMDIKNTGTLAVIGRLPLPPVPAPGRFSVFAKVGYYYSNADLWLVERERTTVGGVTATTARILREQAIEINERDIFYGGGIEFEVWRNWDKEGSYATPLQRADSGIADMTMAILRLQKSISIRLEYEIFPWEDNLVQLVAADPRTRVALPDYEVEVATLSVIFRY